MSLPAQGAEQLRDTAFRQVNAAWWAAGGISRPGDGRFCIDVPAGNGDPWSVMVGQDGLTLAPETGYRLRFSITADPPAAFAAVVQGANEPFEPIARLEGIADEDVVGYPLGFITGDLSDGEAVLQFQFGGAPEPATICLSHASLVDLGPMGQERKNLAPLIRVNQLGYLADGPRRATLLSEATEPVLVRLLAENGTALWHGFSTPVGLDPASWLFVHRIDFSSATADGQGLVLEAGAARSDPFAIGVNPYGPLATDALRFFYLARSGIAIEADFAGERNARPAGHVGVPGGPGLNQGDVAVPCQPLPDWPCDYAQDVTGGWYDAGDHGKYTVPGALAAAQLMAAYARSARDGREARFSDGRFSIPEAGNGVPDLLDEVRWELDWLLRMVVPEGRPLAGMVHHKVHDIGWTHIPILPSDDPLPRRLHRPSTAATLDFAAVAAQGARLFAPFDQPYADRLLAAARRAYDEAIAHPELIAGPADPDLGGGAYDDTDVSDEFYWAAAELFITTGEMPFLEAARASPHWSGPVYPSPIFDWASVAGFARLQLAAHLDRLPPADAELVGASVVSGAEAFLQRQNAGSFGSPYQPTNGLYAWGSNHLVAQAALVMAAGADLSGRADLRDGAIEAMDYIMGRNALGQSYVVGYGLRPPLYPHSRHFAHGLDPLFPPPPDGTLVGGANSGRDDPVASALFAEGCAPQSCYLDDVESWSTNEIAINWNAALVQYSAWLALQ
ncbi:glycoside hydrolase family 9 protein [Devosia enhydra]|uniref:glycoside hydrolase family 9 protein n=1 Tax=Devosia enhydra TaxID=665118 RepID=UPI0015A51794|nr:glycoside hydrolase family 9 protein [Devosia enhydra]